MSSSSFGLLHEFTSFGSVCVVFVERVSICMCVKIDERLSRSSYSSCFVCSNEISMCVCVRARDESSVFVARGERERETLRERRSRKKKKRFALNAMCERMCLAYV